MQGVHVIAPWLLNITSKSINNINQIFNIVSYPPQADMIPVQKHRAQRIPLAEEKKEPYWIYLFIFE